MRLCIAALMTGTVFLLDGTHGEKVWVDHFDDHVIDIAPKGWKGRKQKALEFYKVKMDSEDERNRYLAAHTVKSNMFIIKKMEVDIVKYPFLNWKWRASIFPPDGDESVKRKCDVVASVNVVLVGIRWRPRTIKYSWSSTLPRFTQSKSPFAKWPSRTDIIVLQSGLQRRGQWITEKVNLLQDYKRLYHKDKVDSYTIDAIVIMSDSDNTRSESAADYDDIYFSKE